MTPVEIAAKASWNEKADEFHQWETLSAGERTYHINSMRAGLLALIDWLETEPDSDACIVKLSVIVSNAYDDE